MKKLLKLTPDAILSALYYLLYFCFGVNFTKILRTAFTHADPKSTEMWWLDCKFFVLLGSARTKAVRKMLVKWTPGSGHILIPNIYFLLKYNSFDALHCRISPCWKCFTLFFTLFMTMHFISLISLFSSKTKYISSSYR